MADERLTEHEVALVIRRASELDVGRESVGAGGGLPVSAVEAAAAEVGLSPAATRRALAELRAGALDAEPFSVACARLVPTAPDLAVASVARWLDTQVMARVRHRGAEQIWRQRTDWTAGLRRALDPRGAVQLKGVDEVVVRAVATDGGTLLRVCARLEGAVEASPTIGAGIGATLGGLGAGATQLLASGELTLLATTPAGAVGAVAIGVAGWRLGRDALERRRSSVVEAIEGVLDDVEHRRDRTSPRPNLPAWASRFLPSRGDDPRPAEPHHRHAEVPNSAS